jgi:hypothetical protein
MSTVTVHPTAPVAEPRGARWAVSAVLALRDAFQQLRAGLAERSAHHRRIAEANKLRTLARQVALHDRRVAHEMFAAADRHEQG